jgi:hypothetical protein
VRHEKVRATKVALGRSVRSAGGLRVGPRRDHRELRPLFINNAGVFLHDDLRDRAALEHHLAVNLFGTTA